MSQGTKETKKTGVKINPKIGIICAVAVVAVVAVLLFVFLGNSPEKVAQKYVEAMKEGNADKLMEITDIRGAYAWEKCNRDFSKFNEEYNKATEEDTNSYKDTTKKSIETAMSMIKAFGGIQMNLNRIDKPEKVADGLDKVKVNMQMEVFGEKQEQDIIIVTYKGKYVGTFNE